MTMEGIRFRAAVTDFAANEKKVTAKILVDKSDVSAHEALLSMRGKPLVMTAVEEQCELELGDG